MGASSCVDIIAGATLREAYNQACDEASYSAGNEYSGHINMSRGVSLWCNKVLLEADAIDKGWELIHSGKVQKWDEAVAVTIAVPEHPRTVRVEVDVTGAEWADRERLIRLAVQAKMRPGEGIVSLHSTDAASKTKVVTSPATGTAVREYIVADNWNRPLAVGFTSQADARQAALQMVADLDKPVALHVQARKTRNNGDPNLVTVRRVETKKTVTGGRRGQARCRRPALGHRRRVRVMTTGGTHA